MTPRILLAFTAAFAAVPALAQTPPTAATTSHYGVFATNGTATNYDAKLNGTPVGRGLGVRAAVGGGMQTRPDAVANTFVSPAATMWGGYGLRIHEFGAVHGTNANAGYGAGTSNDAPGTPAPTQGGHSVAITYGVPQNTAGTVSIYWAARASQGANVTAAVDVNGDGTPDWTGSPGPGALTTLPVTAGANGVVLAISTNGRAAVTGVGDASYQADLQVLFRTGGGTLNVTWTPNGPQCLGGLTGTDSQSMGYLNLTLAVNGAAANGFGLMVAGPVLATPVALPFGTCQLLVDPNRGGLRAFATDANGDATLTYRARAIPFTMNFQAVTFGFDPNNNSVLGSTNALQMVAQ